jgi:hypothetical protein
MQPLLQKFLVAGVFLGFLWGVLGGSGEGQEKSMIELKNFQWKNRLLLIFAPSADDSARRSLITELDDQIMEVRERELLIGEILETGTSQFAGAPLHPQSAEALRKRFAVRNGRSIVILIGKDGEVKLRREAPVQAAEIFALIDSMPMRQKEMQEPK